MDFPLAIPEQMSKQLRSFRKVKKLTQLQVAQRMGVAQSRIAAIERDATNITLSQLYKLLALLDAELVVRSRPGHHATDTQPTTLEIPKGEW